MECPPGYMLRGAALLTSRKSLARPSAVALLPPEAWDECIPIPPLRSTSGVDLGPIGQTVLSAGLGVFDAFSLGLTSPLTSDLRAQSRAEEFRTANLPAVSLSREIEAMNGNGFFSDLFSDIGAFFTTEQTFGETLSNVGSDIWGGVTSFLPQVALPIAQQFLPAAPRSGQPGGVPIRSPARPSLPELFLPQFLRPSGQQPVYPPGYGGEPGPRVPGGGWPSGTWEAGTYGEPYTFPAPEGGMAMAAGGVMLPAVRGMGTLALQATVQAMRSQGIRATVSWLAGIIRKWGPAAAVGFLASWVEDQIAQRAVWEAYSHKRRHMNPANTKALRRSLRRLTSFDRLCTRVKKCRKAYKCI